LQSLDDNNEGFDFYFDDPADAGNITVFLSWPEDAYLTACNDHYERSVWAVGIAGP
jgi:hypothetical protein